MSQVFTITDWLKHYQTSGNTPQQAILSLVKSLPANDPAFILVCPTWFLEEQLQRLASLDPTTLPLYGVPFVVKDNIDVAGLPTTAACPEFSYLAKENATVVERLFQAGAILIGKTNLDQFATGLVGTRSPYGAVPNTFDQQYVSGGSSSGSASLVARGIVPFSLGTDTAGSGRIPAGFNNIVGLKATPGKVPMQGVVPACKSIDVVSVFALTVSDAAGVLSVLEETPEIKGSLAFTNQAPWFAKGTELPKIGVPQKVIVDEELGYKECFESAVQQLSETFPVHPIAMNVLDQVAQLLYEGPWVAERFITIENLYQTKPDVIDATVKKVIEKALQFDATTTFKKQYELAELTKEAEKIWSEIDVLVVPTAPTCPTLDAVAKDPIRKNSELGTYTNFVNLLGLSAIAIPMSMSKSGLPFGITLIAPGGSEYALVELANAIQQQTQLFLGTHLRDKNSQDSILVNSLLARPYLELAVVGAHLQGMVLHYQLLERGCQFLKKTLTAKEYRLYSLANTVPPKPGLVRVGDGGVAIEVEIYKIPLDQVGSFLQLIPAPLGLGTIKLADGSLVKGFICEPIGIENASDISEFGGWRNYINHGK